MNQIIRLETDYLRYSFDRFGKALEFCDKGTEKNYAEEGCYAFALLEGNEGDREIELPLEVDFSENILTVRFKQVVFKVLVQCFETNIRMTIINVIPSAFDFGRFLFGNCELKDDGMDPDFCGCIISRSMKCRPVEAPGRCRKVGALAYAVLSAMNVSVAMIGMPPSSLREAIKKAYDGCTIDDVIISSLGGPYAKDIKECHVDYVIQCSSIDYSNDDWIEKFVFE